MLVQLNDNQLYYYIKESFGNSGGVYILKIILETETPMKISRFFDEDQEGIIYIGKASCFLDRVLSLKKTIFMNSKSHIAGRKIKRLNSWFEKIRVETMFVELIQSNSPEDLEREMLDEYLQKFGELPPLNSF